MFVDEKKASTYHVLAVPGTPGSPRSPSVSEFGRSMSGQVAKLARRRPMRVAFAAFFIIAAQLCWAASSFVGTRSLASQPNSKALSVDHLQWTESECTTTRDKVDDTNLHFLIPATDGNSHLCKTLLTAGVLGYPSPTIIAWKESLVNKGLGGGSHLLKISRTLSYLNSLSKEQDNELVFMIDAYDIHFQLPVEILIERYHRINARQNERLRQELGPAYEKEGIRQSVVFGAGKKCAPNALWEIACYTMPRSPAPDDLYHNNTDTGMGHTPWFSMKQRYINSGYILGPVHLMRKMFERAQEKAEQHKDHPIYDSSDQAIFALIYGEQNYMREVERLKHVSSWDKFWHPKTATKPRDTVINGVYIDNILHPSVSVTRFKPKENRNYEFGIGVDLFSELGHQAMHSDIGRDGQWLFFDHPDNKTFHEQAQSQVNRHGSLDCPVRTPTELPDDIANLSSPFDILRHSNLPDKVTWMKKTWRQVSLYSQLCMGTIPVMIHHNGNKDNRDKRWQDVWMQPRVKNMLIAAMEQHGPAWDVGDWNEFKKRPRIKMAGGSWTDRGEWINWPDMCPDNQYAEKLFS